MLLRYPSDVIVVVVIATVHVAVQDILETTMHASQDQVIESNGPASDEAQNTSTSSQHPQYSASPLDNLHSMMVSSSSPPPPPTTTATTTIAFAITTTTTTSITPTVHSPTIKMSTPSSMLDHEDAVEIQQPSDEDKREDNCQNGMIEEQHPVNEKNADALPMTEASLQNQLPVSESTETVVAAEANGLDKVNGVIEVNGVNEINGVNGVDDEVNPSKVLIKSLDGLVGKGDEQDAGNELSINESHSLSEEVSIIRIHVTIIHKITQLFLLDKFSTISN